MFIMKCNKLALKINENKKNQKKMTYQFKMISCKVFINGNLTMKMHQKSKKKKKFFKQLSICMIIIQMHFFIKIKLNHFQMVN